MAETKAAADKRRASKVVAPGDATAAGLRSGSAPGHWNDEQLSVARGRGTCTHEALLALAPSLSWQWNVRVVIPLTHAPHALSAIQFKPVHL